MPRFSNFGIWKKELNVLLDAIQPITKKHKESWHEWFCDKGIIYFQDAVHKAAGAHNTKAYTNRELNPDGNPIFTIMDIIDKYTAGFAAMRPEFLKIIPTTLTSNDKEKVAAFFDTFQKTALTNHQQFFALEARVVTNTKCPGAPGAKWMMHQHVLEEHILNLYPNISDDDEETKEQIPDPATEQLADDVHAYLVMRTEFNREFDKLHQQFSLANNRNSTFATAPIPANTSSPTAELSPKMSPT